MNKQRYLIKTGEFAGKVVEGQGCNARPFPDSTDVDSAKYGDGIYIPELGLRLKQERHGYTVKDGLTVPTAKHCADFVNYEDLVVAFDKNGNELFVGDTVYAAIKNVVCLVKITKIGDVYHQGCGWMTRKFTVEGEGLEKKVTLTNPSAVIKVS
jgi:hypothetical protein